MAEYSLIAIFYQTAVVIHGLKTLVCNNIIFLQQLIKLPSAEFIFSVILLGVD